MRRMRSCLLAGAFLFLFAARLDTLGQEGIETVALALAAGPYVIGSPSNAAVVIVDAIAAAGVTNYWIAAGGELSGDWTNAQHWSAGRAPVREDRVFFTNQAASA